MQTKGKKAGWCPQRTSGLVLNLSMTTVLQKSPLWEDFTSQVFICFVSLKKKKKKHCFEASQVSEKNKSLSFDMQEGLCLKSLFFLPEIGQVYVAKNGQLEINHA